MNIAGWMADWSGCGFYRIALPGAELRRRGHVVNVNNDLRTKRDFHDAVNDALCVLPRPGTQDRTILADVIVGQRINLPGPSQLWQYIARQPHRPKLVFEIDDDLFNIDPSNERAYKYFMQPEVQHRMAVNAQVADTITVSTTHLKHVMMEVTGKPRNAVRVVLNTVPQALLNLPRPEPRDRIVVGWAGSTTHAMDWKPAMGVVGQFLCSRPDVEFHMIGANYPLPVPLDQYRHSPWRNTVPAYWRSIDFDIGLAPLADHPFNHSKSHIKALEYAALGIPVIASDVGPYREFVKHGETGCLVPPNKPHLWMEYLEVLTLDTEFRHQLGQNAKKHAQKYLIEKWGPIWELALS